MSAFRSMVTASAVSALCVALALPAEAAPIAVDPNGYVPYVQPTVPSPKGVAVSDGTAVVAGSGDSTVTVLSTCQPKSCRPGSGPTVPTGPQPTDVAIARGTDSVSGRAYVTNGGNGTVTLIPYTAGITPELDAPVSLTVGGVPTGIALSPDGRWAYIADNLSDALVIYDTVNLRVDGRVAVGAGPWGVAVSPDGARVYVAANEAGNVSVVDTASRTVIAAIPVGMTPGDIALDPSGRTLYVPSNGSGTVSVIDTATSSVRAIVPVGSQPWGVAATDTHAFVANFASGNVSVIDGASAAVIATVATGTSPFGVAIDDDRQVLVTNAGSSTLSAIALTADTPAVNWSANRRMRTVIGVVPAMPAVTYGIVSRKGAKTRSGTCATSADRVVCRVRVGTGTWRTSVTTQLPWQTVPGGRQNKGYTFH